MVDSVTVIFNSHNHHPPFPLLLNLHPRLSRLTPPCSMVQLNNSIQFGSMEFFFIFFFKRKREKRVSEKASLDTGKFRKFLLHFWSLSHGFHYLSIQITSAGFRFSKIIFLFLKWICHSNSCQVHAFFFSFKTL